MRALQMKFLMAGKSPSLSAAAEEAKSGMAHGSLENKRKIDDAKHFLSEHSKGFPFKQLALQRMPMLVLLGRQYLHTHSSM